MSFLRRRGNMASENDMRRHTFFATSPSDELSPLPTQPERADDDDGHGEPIPNISSRKSTSSARPDTPPIQEQSSKHRRFSILRHRNASDSQLSVRARQQAEQPPPVPRRNTPLRSPSPLLT